MGETVLPSTLPLPQTPEFIAAQNIHTEKERYYQNLVESKAFLQQHLEKLGKKKLDGWIVCGSGLSGLPDAEGVEILNRIPMESVPNFRVPKAPGHGKEILIASIGGQTVGIQTGRMHPYDTDGSPQEMREATTPLVVAKGLGIDWLVTTSAVGVLDNGRVQKGDVIVNGQLRSDMVATPLLGENDERLGQRFPAKFPMYDSELYARLEDCLPENRLYLGLYNVAQPPFYESATDIDQHSYPTLLANNPDWVSDFGMSLGMEAPVLFHYNNPPKDEEGFDRQVRWLSVSVATNIISHPTLPSKETIRRGLATNPNPTNAEEVLQAGHEAEQLLIPAVVRFCQSLSSRPISPL